MKYSVFGEIRDINGTSPTDYLYTGQRKEVEFGLSYYVARWYDAEPMLSIGLREFECQILQDENLSFSSGHFISADTLDTESKQSFDLRRIYFVNSPIAACCVGDSQAWDRFAYVLNNPMKYIDPSGMLFEYPFDPIPQIEGDDDITRNTNQKARDTANNRVKTGPTMPYPTQYELGACHSVGSNDSGRGTCALANAAYATGSDPHVVYSSFANDNQDLPDSWWSHEDLAYFINNSDLFPSWTAESGALTDFYQLNNRYGYFGSAAIFINETLGKGQNIIAMISANSNGYPKTGGRKEDKNHWVTIIDMSPGWSKDPSSIGNIINYYDSQTGNQISVTWKEFFYSWVNLPTNLNVVILTQD